MRALAALLLLTGAHAEAQDAATVRHPNVTISLLASPPTGATQAVALRVRLDPGWHIYWRNPGMGGIATSVEWRLPAGARTDSLTWPVPEWYDVSGIITHVLRGEVALTTTLQLPSGARGGRVEAEVRYGLCKEVCVPGAATLRLDLGRPSSAVAWREAERLAMARRPLVAGAPQVAATSGAEGVTLVVRAAAGGTLPDTLTFYATERDVLPAAVRIPIPRGRQEVRFVVPARGRLARLRGVLVGGSPTRRDPVGWAVDVPVGRTTPGGSAPR